MSDLPEMSILDLYDLGHTELLENLEQARRDTEIHSRLQDEVLRRMIGNENDDWISVERDLPDTCRQVLIAYEEGTVSTATWLPEQGDFQGRKLQYITHWRELPEPPSERDE